jgi:predicted transcriptional regulator
MDTKTLIHKLLSDAERNGISVAQVARSAAIDPSLISRWKHGLVEPRLSTLNRVRTALDKLIAERRAA